MAIQVVRRDAEQLQEEGERFIAAFNKGLFLETSINANLRLLLKPRVQGNIPQCTMSLFWELAPWQSICRPLEQDPRTIFHFLRYEHTSIPCRFKSQMLKETLITRSTCSGSHEALLWLANTVYAKTPKKAPRNHTVSGDGTINMQTETRTSFGFIT